MHSPVDQRFIKTQHLMKTGQMIGLDRAVGRVTWAKGSLMAVKSNHPGVGNVRFLDKSVPEYEIASIRTIDITRSIGQDAATCTITMYNARSASTQPEGLDLSGTTGYLTPGRGTARPLSTSVYSTMSMDDLYGSLHIDYPTDWEYTRNPYRDVFIPNTVLRTYQGYGSDNFDPQGNVLDVGDPDYIAPARDSKLYPTGVWLIDKITFTSDGAMSVECRDLAKLLIEQIVYPPMLPVERFPLVYYPAKKASGKKESIGKNVATFHSSSVDKVYGWNHKVMGHRGSDAFDGRTGSFWLSGPNSAAGGVEWLQAKVYGSINELVITAWEGNYVAYICVHEKGKWQGSAVITGNGENLDTYDGNSPGFFYVIAHGDTLWDLAGTYYGDNFKWPIIATANNNIIKDPHWIYPGQKIKIPYVAGTKSAGPGNSGGSTGGTSTTIPYVKAVTIPHSGKATVTLPRTYKADYVRVVFTSLSPKLGGGTYRAGMRELVVRNHIQDSSKATTIGKAGYLGDWSEAVKELCAWPGLTWVNAPTADPLLGTATVANAYTNKHMAQPGVPAPASGHPSNLRVWGDFEVLGAWPIADTPGDYFLNKSFMDCIRLIVDFIGAVFYIDESGGAQFRLANIWSGGNFFDDPQGGTSLAAYTGQHPIEFHEDANIVEYTMVISDEALRSEVLVVGGWPNRKATGPVAGGYVLGYNKTTGSTSAIDFSNVLAGQYRMAQVPGESTNLFITETECQRMAELTALFILFTYRQGSLKSPAHPGLQIDDQIRIYERITNESYIHYVSSMDTHQDLETGEYTMTVSTHWLGSDPNKDWFINKQQLTPAVTQLPALYKRMGLTRSETNDPPYTSSTII